MKNDNLNLLNASGQRISVALFLFVGLVLVTLTAIRIVLIPFNHDESYSVLGHSALSYKDIILYNGPLRANNHLLTTLWMKVVTYFTYTEWVLRLPSLIAQIIYLFASIIISFRLKRVFSQWALLISLNGNPLLLEYFYQARGYGLACGFLLLAIAVFFYNAQISYKNILLSHIFAGLSVFANFSFVNFFIPFIGITILIFGLKLYRQKKLSIQLLSLFAIPSLVLSYTVFGLRKILQMNDVYYGGVKNFFHDTVMSLTRYSFLYDSQDALISKVSLLIVISSVVISLLLIAFLIFRIIKMKPFLTVVFFTFWGTIFLILIQHIFLHVKFPLDRTALYIIPTFTLFLIVCIHELFSHRKAHFILRSSMVLVSLFVLYGFFSMFNILNPTYDQSENSTKKMIDYISEQEPGKQIIIWTDWERNQSISFYLKQKNIDTIQIDISPSRPYGREIDYIYKKNTEKGDIIIESYSESDYFLAQPHQ